MDITDVVANREMMRDNVRKQASPVSARLRVSDDDDDELMMMMMVMVMVMRRRSRRNPSAIARNHERCVVLCVAAAAYAAVALVETQKRQKTIQACNVRDLIVRGEEWEVVCRPRVFLLGSDQRFTTCFAAC